MEAQGIRGEGLGVRSDHKSKLFKPLLQVFRGSPIMHFDRLGVRGIFFDFRGPWRKKD